MLRTAVLVHAEVPNPSLARCALVPARERWLVRQYSSMVVGWDTYDWSFVVLRNGQYVNFGQVQQRGGFRPVEVFDQHLVLEEGDELLVAVGGASPPPIRVAFYGSRLLDRA